MSQSIKSTSNEPGTDLAGELRSLAVKMPPDQQRVVAKLLHLAIDAVQQNTQFNEPAVREIMDPLTPEERADVVGALQAMA